MNRLLLTIIAMLACGSAYAGETMRCGGRLVTAAATVDELLQKCGEPSAKESSQADVRRRNLNGAMVKAGTVVTEYWTYDRGTQAAAVLVTISEGRIRSMERVSR